MKRLWVLFAALGALLLLFPGEAFAIHFRYGTLNWVVPDPSAPLTVKFTVQYAIVSGSQPSLQDVTLFYGDGADSGQVIGAVIGTATDAGNQSYEVREFSVTHTYPAAATYTAYFSDCCRISQLVNGAGLDYRVDAKVSLQAGNSSGPVSASPPVVQLQVGGTRTYTWPVIDPDADPVTCRFGTEAEVGFPNPVPVVPDPGGGLGGQSPTLATVPNGCELTWDLVDAQVNQRYVVHIVFESTHGGEISSTALDLIVETVLPPPPTCAGGGIFTPEAGELLAVPTTATSNVAGNLAVSAINLPAGATISPGGSGPSPFSNTFTWTPAAGNAGSTYVVLLNYTSPQNLTGTCFLTIQVPTCSNYGDPCTAGLGECQSSGTNVCNGSTTVCSAAPGTPTAEICDGKDNDCDGSTDEGNPGSGVACSTGLPGACATGLTTCAAGVTECAPDVTPGQQVELCNAGDDDCDGDVDEDFDLGAACTVGTGQCAATGAIVCEAGTGAAICDATPGAPVAEICGDGLDQDCDGAADNGCIDTDGDGLFDDEEVAAGTDPTDADSDDDGLPDGQEPAWSQDTDGDGLLNALDPDSDNDGLYDGTEAGKDCSDPDTDVSAGHCVADADMGATVTDPLDADTDDGSVSDGSEDANHNGAVDPGETDPTAGHGADDVGAENLDTDGDGLTDAEELAAGTDPNDADTDDDGALDGQEANWSDDTDGDGLINALDPDSDNDGLFDGTEMGKDCSDPATDVAAGNCIADADSGATVTSPLDADTDDGGVSDGAEDANHDGALDPGETDPTAGHGADDALVTDTDGDGLSDDEETFIGTDPNDADSDDDGLLDGQEPNPTADTDGDGLINALDPDSDGDGLWDGTEAGKDCSNPATDPSAGTCIPDADPSTTTSPLDADTDDGGATDGAEDTNKNGAVDPGERDPTAGHGGDDLTGDTDGDGLTDDVEIQIGTDPNDADSDDDGVPDGQEPLPGTDSDGDGLINALDPDSDNDGLFDGTELGLGCGGPGTNTGVGNCVPDADTGTKTDPLDADTDDGGVSDGAEDANHNGALDDGETDPTAGHGDDDSSNVDTDGDGLTDAEEDFLGTDPNDADSDDDGVIDGDEPNPGADTDGDGLINALDADSDNDGLFDGTEMGLDCSNPATDPSADHCIPDADPSTTTSPLLDDTDGGTVKDGDEDKNHNGALDEEETDPTAGHGDDDLSCFDDTACGDTTSGKVCDLTTHECVDGCHTPGNGCPTGKVCTSNDETIGECVECVIDASCAGDQVCDMATHTCVDKAGCDEDADCGGAGDGMVCDEATSTCVEGCREDGDECAEGLECALPQAQTIGVCQPIEPDEIVIAEGGGLMCAASPANDNGRAGWLLPLALGGLLAARRRRSAGGRRG